VADARAARSQAKPAASNTKAGPQTEAPPATGHGGAVCSVAFCPICATVAALGELKPEVIDHLMVAGREFLLAVRALIDSRLESMTSPEPGERRVERIPVD
jgi:hypothetical protein